MIEQSNQIEPDILRNQNHSIIDKIFKEESSLYIFLQKQKSFSEMNHKANETFSSILNNQLKELRESMSSILLSTEKEMNSLFDDYSSKIHEYICFKETQLLNLPGIKEKLSSQPSLEQNDVLPLFAYVEKNIFKKITSLIELNTSIQTTIKSTLALMKFNLEDIELIKSRNPIEAFVVKQIDPIFSSWLMSIINYENINLSLIPRDHKVIYQVCKNTVFQRIEKNKTCINYDKAISKEKYHSSFILNSLDHLNKIKVYRIDDKEMKKPFLFERDSFKCSNLASIKLLECNFRDQQWKQINTEGFVFPSKKLHLKKTLFHYGLIQSLTLFPQLKQLTLKKCNLNDLSFNSLIEVFRNNEKLVDSLEKISFADNHLTLIQSIFVINQYSKKEYFKSLKELSFEGNNIYEISKENFFLFPNLKIMNLCNNNFSSFTYLDLIIEKNKTKKCFLLFAGNICLVNNKAHNYDYFNYLNKTIVSFDYPLKKLSLAYMFNCDERIKLMDTVLCPYSSLYLQRLNLSNCYLLGETIISFMKNNGGLINLTHLVLNNNKLRIDFFTLMNNENTRPIRLKKIDVSYNEIQIEDNNSMQSILSFCERNPYLKVIKIQNTGLERMIMNKLDLLLDDVFMQTKETFNICCYNMINYQKKFEVQMSYKTYKLTDFLKKLIKLKNKKI